MKRLIITSCALFIMAASAPGQQSDFRWLNARDSVLLTQVKAAFSTELTPDGNDPQSSTVPMTVKFVDRTGLRGNSALVVIGEKENKADPYTVSRAFNFNLITKEKSLIRGKDSEWFWMWRVEKVAHLTSAADTDVVFQFLTCTECESQRILGAFHYSSKTGSWELREWSKEDGSGLLIGSDVQYGDDGLYYYDCLHAVSDITGNGLDDVAIRCRESVEADPGKPKKVTRDETVLYTAGSDGKLTRTVIGQTSQYAKRVENALCASMSESPLCRKPAATSSKSHRP